MFNTDCLVTLAPVKGLDRLSSKRELMLEVDVFTAGKMGKRKDLSGFEKGRTEMV